MVALLTITISYSFLYILSSCGSIFNPYKPSKNEVGGDGDVTKPGYLAFVKLLITLSISLYIMCFILCLFSALIRKVGALQISIIILLLFRRARTNLRLETEGEWRERLKFKSWDLWPEQPALQASASTTWSNNLHRNSVTLSITIILKCV